MVTSDVCEKYEKTISIIIPAYNVPVEYLSNCIESVLEQELGGIEIICIDDASTDQTYDNLIKYANEDSRLIVLRNETNKGFLHSRNIGITIANGKYLFFLDADDTINRNSLSVLYDRAEKDELEMLFFDMCISREKNELQNTEFDTDGLIHKGDYPDVCTGVDMFESFARNGCNYGATTLCLYNRRFLHENEIDFDEDIEALDELFYCKSMFKAKRVGYINLVAYNYFLRKSSMEHSENRVNKRYLGALKNCVKTIDFFENNKEISQEIPYSVNQYKNWTYSTLLSAAKKVSNIDKQMKERIKDGKVGLLHDFCCFLRLKSNDVNLDSASVRKAFGEGKKILIYGAGNDAVKVCNILNELGVNRFYMVVTEASEGLYVMGIRVREISEFVCVRNDCFVIIASRKYMDQMISNVIRNGFCNYSSIY